MSAPRAAAAIAQAAGLGRWFTVVPLLGAAHQSPAARDATRQAADLVSLAVQQFPGIGVVDAIGPALLAGWTLQLGRWLLEDGRRWRGHGGRAAVPVWVAAFAGFGAAPLAFVAWEAWIATLGLLWLAFGQR